MVPARAGGMGGPGPRQPLPEGRPGEGREALARATTLLLVLARPRHCCWKSHSCSGGHTGPHRRSVRLAEAPRPQAGWLGPGAWGPAPWRWTGQLCGPARGSVGLVGLCFPGWDGVGRGGGPSRLTWDWLAVVRQMRLPWPTTPPGPVCPAKRIWDRRGRGVPQHPVILRLVCPNPLARIHLILGSCWTPSPSEGISLQGAPPGPLACPPETVEGAHMGLPEGPLPPPCTMLPSPASPERGACSGCQHGPHRLPPAPRAPAQQDGGLGVSGARRLQEHLEAAGP